MPLKMSWTHTLDIFISLFFRKKIALPEDIEYFNIQLQMNYDLFDEYREVERIIGMYE